MHDFMYICLPIDMFSAVFKCLKTIESPLPSHWRRCRRPHVLPSSREELSLRRVCIVAAVVYCCLFLSIWLFNNTSTRGVVKCCAHTLNGTHKQQLQQQRVRFHFHFNLNFGFGIGQKLLPVLTPCHNDHIL